MTEKELSIAENPEFKKLMSGAPLDQRNAVAAFFDAQLLTLQIEESNLRTYRQALEIIGVCDCADPQAVAASALVETGFWSAPGDNIPVAPSEPSQGAEIEQDERALFETYMRQRWPSSAFERAPDGSYIGHLIEDAWAIWKVRAAIGFVAASAQGGNLLTKEHIFVLAALHDAESREVGDENLLAFARAIEQAVRAELMAMGDLSPNGELTFKLNEIFAICDEYANFFSARDRADMAGAVSQVRSRFQYLQFKNGCVRVKG